jgi:hypothetical protein
MRPVEKKQQRSPWLYVGIGCGALLLVGVFVVGVILVLTVSTVEEFQKDMADPAALSEKVKKTLGADTLPEGYFPIMSLNVPLVMETAILSTRPPEGGAFKKEEERFFMYFHLKASSTNDMKDIRDYLEGRSDDTSALERNDIQVDTDKVIGHGALQFDGRRVLYLMQRGELRTNQSDGNEGPGLNSLLLIECPGQSTVRIAIWTSPDPMPGAPLEELDLKGTPVHEETMKSFMSHLNPCKQES